jgi:hypothetical protein
MKIDQQQARMLELQNTSVECQGVAVRFEKEKR